MGGSFKPVAGALCFLIAVWLVGAHAPAQIPNVRVEEAWVRWLPADLPAAGYATLTNTGDSPVKLVSASSSGYAEVSLHRSVKLGTSVSMQPAAALTISPHSSVEFAKLGYHFMLMRPVKALQVGDHVPITLRFADGRSTTIEFEVRK